MRALQTLIDADDFAIFLGAQNCHQEDKGAFKTPTLRDVARRGPYMHDGGKEALADVVAFYNAGGTKNPWLSGQVRPLGLAPREQADLVEFMEALTGQIDPETGRAPILQR